MVAAAKDLHGQCGIDPACNPLLMAIYMPNPQSTPAIVTTCSISRPIS